MRFSLTILNLFLIHAVSFAQFSTDTIFYDKSWKESTRLDAAYYRLYQHETNEKYYVEDYYINGNIQMKGNFSSLYPSRKHGGFKYYNEQGLLTLECNYIDNKKEGKSIQYFDNGNIMREDFFSTGCIISTKCYTETGTVSTCSSDLVETRPEYPGGFTAMYKFLRENIIYPPKAKKRNIQGIVHLQFIVGRDGSIQSVKITKSVHELVDEEAVRVVKLMPKWKPGTQKGFNIPVIFNLPLEFKLK